jgi:predicted nuclease of restriction endonuclease-like RecB superfamily
MALFQKGQARTGGRRAGSRNRLSNDFIDALAKEFAEHGNEAMRLCRVERPIEFLKLVASIIPKEFEITDSRLKDIPDDELDALIEIARRRISASIPRDAEDGKEAPLN